ncbi:hypothetical protein NQ315_011058 [Exocentrus adspersus]|uniref:Uncharacterized protein n=1 Tax=Exocentrus adspersus TaxID=1586481 RepID=A0AAV8V8L5_9CUCU|nr:hypothetical protein NQ315_011058 [Exocentrus adspersus]
MVNLTEQERISLLMMRGWGDRERSYEEVVHLFNDTFRVRQTQIHKSTVSRTINRFLETSTNKDRPKSGRPKTQTTEERQGEVAQSFIENHRVYFTKPQDLLELRQRIINTSAEIPADIIHTAIENFYVRLGQCQEVNGEHFENLRLLTQRGV